MPAARIAVAALQPPIIPLARSAVPSLAQEAVGRLLSGSLSIAVTALAIFPLILASARAAQVEAHQLENQRPAIVWALSRGYLGVFSAIAVICSLVTCAAPGVGLAAAGMYAVVCWSLVRNIRDTAREGRWLPPDDPVAWPIAPVEQEDGQRAPAFPPEPPMSQGQGWKRNNDLLGSDGGAFSAPSSPTDSQVFAASETLQLHLIRYLGGADAAHFTDLGPALAWLARQRSDAFSNLKRAVATFQLLAGRTDEIRIPLVEAADLARELTGRASREHRPLTNPERDRLVPGLLALMEGLQRCSGAWTAHLPLVVDLLRGDSLSPRRWILRLFAQERLTIVERYFRERLQQVHYINQLRWELHTLCRIALPGARESQRDWHVGQEDHAQSRNELAWTIHTLQNPVGLASTLLEALNRPSASSLRLKIQAEITRSLMHSSETQNRLRNRLSNIFREASEAPSTIDPISRQSELEESLAGAKNELERVLPWGPAADDVASASPLQSEQALHRLLANPGVPASLIEAIQEVSQCGDRVAATRERVRRALARAEHADPAVQKARNSFNLRKLEATQLRNQIRALEPLVDQLQGNRTSLRPLQGVVSRDAMLKTVLQRVSSLSERLAEAGFSSAWQLMEQAPEQTHAALLSWLQSHGQDEQRLVEHLGASLLAIYAQQILSSYFQNDLVTHAGAFHILFFYGFLQRI